MLPGTSRFRSLYAHFPFCESRCHSCDFYEIGRDRVGAAADFEADRFAKALRSECEHWADRLDDQIDTVFFGGGTPTLTPPETMRWAIEPLHLQSRLAPDYEWTMEANPSSISLERMRAYRDMGINRVSMGVQSLQDGTLKRLGRVHDRRQALGALATLFDAGFTNVSTDLICGVPGSAISDLEASLEALAQFPITHLSCYLLTLPPHHAMYRDLPDEDEQLRQLLWVDEWLVAKGFEHYEISNFARGGSSRRARHNLVYWTGGPYLGLGPSAHSFGGGKRWKNVSSLRKYAELLGNGSAPTEQVEEVSPEQKRLERWLLSVRLADGFPSDWVDTASLRPKADRLLAEGLLAPATPAGRLRLTPKGFALSDSIVRYLAG